MLLSEKYNSGEYKNLATKSGMEIREEKEEAIMIPQTKQGGKKIVMVVYKVYGEKYSQLHENEKYNCMYCLMRIEKDPVGIPIRREVINDEIHFHMIDVFCSISCALAELLARVGNNVIYGNSYEYLYEISLAFTGKAPQSAGDKRLLKIFNGHLTWEEFHRETKSFSNRSPNISFHSVLENIDCNEKDHA